MGRSGFSRLRSSRGRVLVLAAALLAGLVLLAPPAAQAAKQLDSVGPVFTPPPSLTEPPPGFNLTGKQAERTADATPEVRGERRKRGKLTVLIAINQVGQWELNYFDRRENFVAQVTVDDNTGRVAGAWTGIAAHTFMARGDFGGKLMRSTWPWVVLCVLFLAPFFDVRRPFRLLHLDLLVLLSFGISVILFNRGDVESSVWLVYPPLAYLLGRLLWAGFRPRDRDGPLVPHVPTAVLAVGLALLIGGRVAANIANDKVIDVGYASVVGADRIAHKLDLYVNNDARGDTYGPVNYLAYIPFELVFPFEGRWDNLPAAHAAAITFDLLTMLGLFVLGFRIRPGPAGRRLGVALAFAWAAYPFTLYAMATNTNDGLVAMLVIWALVLFSSPMGRGALVGLAAAAKFAPLALAAAFLRDRQGLRVRPAATFLASLVGVVALSILLYLPDGGLREFYDTTLGWQFSRPSAFSPWGQDEGWKWLQTVLKVFAVALAVTVAFVPRRRTLTQAAALGAALLLAVTLPAIHWFYFYIVWFAPLALAALFAEYGSGTPPGAPVAAPPEAEREQVPAAA